MKNRLTIITVLLLCQILYAAPAAVTVVPTSLPDFGYVTVGTISAEQTYTVSGNKNVSVIITSPAGFKVSTVSGGPYSSSVTVGAYTLHTIYVVFEPVAEQAYSGNIANVMGSPHTASANVSVSGNGITVADPASFSASQVTSHNEIDLDWTKNPDGDNVMVARNLTGTFGTPVNGDTYVATDTISGGGLVIYNGGLLTFTDSGLVPNTLYYYKAWSVDTDGAINPAYSPGVTDSATTAPEPGVVVGLVLAGLAMVRARS